METCASDNEPEVEKLCFTSVKWLAIHYSLWPEICICENNTCKVQLSWVIFQKLVAKTSNFIETSNFKRLRLFIVCFNLYVDIWLHSKKKRVWRRNGNIRQVGVLEHF